MRCLQQIKSQFPQILKREYTLFTKGKVKLAILFLGPAVISYVLTLVLGGKFSTDLSKNICALLIMVISAMYIGMSNSLLVICNQKVILKYEFILGINSIAYILAISVIQLLICLIQAIIFSTVYLVQMSLPSSGLLCGDVLNWIISFLLILFASDMLGLTISNFVSNGETANFIAPIILIILMVFSGTIFSFKDGVFNKVQDFTVTRWGMSSIGSLIDVGTINMDGLLDGMFSQEDISTMDKVLEMKGTSWNEIEESFSEQMVKTSGIDTSIYIQTNLNLLKCWGHLLAISFVLLIIDIIGIQGIKRMEER